MTATFAIRTLQDGQFDPRRLCEQPSDDRLLERLRSGDQGAGDALVRLYGGRMLAVARRLLRTEEDSADAVQDAFRAALCSLDGFEGNAALGTWLHRIV